MTGRLPLIVFIDLVRIQIGVHDAQIKTWELPNTLVLNGKIINRSLFATEFENFFTTQRISPGPVLIILGEGVCFTHGIKAEQAAEKEQLSRNFYDMVPAEMVVKREYEIGREVVLVAADSEFIGSIVAAFVQVGCTISVVVPHVVLPQVGAKRWLDPEYVAYMIKNAGELAPWSMQIAESKPVESNDKPVANPKKSKPPYMLIGVFVILIIILIVTVVTMT